MGWPLPQLGVPQWTHSSPPDSRSIDPQNCGVMPVYVGFLSNLPFFPFLISHPSSQPNWKFSRLSSIDQDRLVSINTPLSVSAIVSSNVWGPGNKADVGHSHHREAVRAVSSYHSPWRQARLSC